MWRCAIFMMDYFVVLLANFEFVIVIIRTNIYVLFD